MTKIPVNNMVPSNPGFLQDLILRAKLIYRLMRDKRVSPLLKVLPIGAILYLIIPLDVAIGPFDDAAVLGLASYLFVELCPDAVVQEHSRALRLSNKTMKDAKIDEELVIDGEFVESNEEKGK
ncbi:MAG: hypothetical protein C0391_05510 [Anaerolinea sp.]|nr:hypothetical protein [Anaerolinea sp.]